MNKRLVIKMTTAIFSSALLIFSFGQGCSKFATMDLSGGNSTGSTASTVGDDPTILPNTGTVSLVYGKQVLDHYSSCIGSGLPTDRTLGVYASKAGTISETGAVATLTAPMLMAATSIAGEVCEDLIQAEKKAPRIFIGFNLSGSSLPTQANLQDAMRRMARSCWSRDEDPQEADIVMNAVSSAFSGGDAANTAHDAALFMCTSMLGALDSLVL